MWRGRLVRLNMPLLFPPAYVFPHLLPTVFSLHPPSALPIYFTDPPLLTSSAPPLLAAALFTHSDPSSHLPFCSAPSGPSTSLPFFAPLRPSLAFGPPPASLSPPRSPSLLTSAPHLTSHLSFPRCPIASLPNLPPPPAWFHPSPPLTSPRQLSKPATSTGWRSIRSALWRILSGR